MTLQVWLVAGIADKLIFSSLKKKETFKARAIVLTVST